MTALCTIYWLEKNLKGLGNGQIRSFQPSSFYVKCSKSPKIKMALASQKIRCKSILNLREGHIHLLHLLHKSHCSQPELIKKRQNENSRTQIKNMNIHFLSVVFTFVVWFWMCSGTGKWFQIKRRQVVFLWWDQGPLLLTWFNFNPSMDK